METERFEVTLKVLLRPHGQTDACLACCSCPLCTGPVPSAPPRPPSLRTKPGPAAGASVSPAPALPRPRGHAATRVLPRGSGWFARRVVRSCLGRRTADAKLHGGVCQPRDLRRAASSFSARLWAVNGIRPPPSRSARPTLAEGHSWCSRSSPSSVSFPRFWLDWVQAITKICRAPFVVPV